MRRSKNHFKSALRMVVIALLMMGSVQIHAEGLVVIEDNGATDVRALLNEIIGPDIESAKKTLDFERSQLKEGEYSKQKILDKFSPQLPVGSQLIERKIRSADFTEPKNNVTQPIAVIGTGRLSKEWLNKHKTKLKELNTFVVIGKADSLEEVGAIENVFGEALPVMNVDAVIEQFGIKGIPALVTQSGVYQ